MSEGQRIMSGANRTDWKTVAIGDFLTREQSELVVKLWGECKSGRLFRAAVVEKVIVPNLAEINRKLGQENDARFLAYAVEYALSRRT